MSNISDIVATNVRELRRARKWSAREVAEQCADRGAPGLNRPTIASIETRRRSYISVDELVIFAEVFGVQPEELLTPFVCQQCHGAPPAGFTCKKCGADA